MTKFKILFLINPSLEFVHECIMAIFPKTLSDKFAMPDFHTCRIEICVHGIKESLISSTVLLLSSKHMQIMLLKVELVSFGKV